MRRGRPSGFTLVELMIVVAILGIVALLAAPVLADAGRSRTVEAARLTAAAVQYAQTRAILTRRTHYLKLDDAGRLAVVADDDDATAQVPVPDPVGGGPLLVPLGRRPFEGVGVARFDTGHAERPMLGFDARGLPLACRPGDPADRVALPGDAVLRLAHGGRTIDVSVDADTGQVRVGD